MVMVVVVVGGFEDQTHRSHNNAPAVVTGTRTGCSELQDAPEHMPDMGRGKSLRALELPESIHSVSIPSWH